MRWMNLTPAQAALIFNYVLKISQPPRVMPPVVPGDPSRLAENPRDPEAIDRLHRRLFG